MIKQQGMLKAVQNTILSFHKNADHGIDPSIFHQISFSEWIFWIKMKSKSWKDLGDNWEKFKNWWIRTTFTLKWGMTFMVYILMLMDHILKNL